MSTKDNIDFIKQEVSSQEKFLEGFFHIEKYYRKYKIPILAIAVVAIVAIIGYNVNNYIEGQDKIKANAAYNALQKEHSAEQESLLKKYAPKLHQVYAFRQFLDGKIDTAPALDIGILQDILDYQQATLGRDATMLDKYSLGQEASLKDMALLSQSFLLIKEGDSKQAIALLDTIPATSQLQTFAKLLKHYTITTSTATPAQ